MFDSSTIDLCTKLFPWAKFHKHKSGVKLYMLFDVETYIPAFIHITQAKVSDVNAMDVIPYVPGSYYVFDRAYNDFRRLYKIHFKKSYFVVRTKKNMQYKVVKWKRRLPKNIISDSTIRLTGVKTASVYSQELRLFQYWDEEDKREFVYITNAKHIIALQVANLYKNRWQVELIFYDKHIIMQSQSIHKSLSC